MILDRLVAQLQFRPRGALQVVQERLLFRCQPRLHAHDRQVTDLLPTVLHLSLLRLQVGHPGSLAGSRVEPITLQELLKDAQEKRFTIGRVVPVPFTLLRARLVKRIRLF
jgi:hypothetical protein